MVFDDTFIPIYMSLQYDGNLMKFPINPEKLSILCPSNSDKATVEKLGEVSIQKIPGLKTFTISSFFWGAVSDETSDTYVKWILDWQKSGKKANFIMTKLNFTMAVTCESFEYEIRAGEEQDVYFNLELQEYRKYGAKRLGDAQSILNIFDKLTDKLQSMSTAPSVLIEVPRLDRLSISKKLIESPYTTTEKDTLTGIAKKITGTTDKWRELYEKNASKIGTELLPDVKLDIPESWLSATHNILSW